MKSECLTAHGRSRMLTMAKKHQGPQDFAETAFKVFEQAVGDAKPKDDDKDPAAVALGRKGGLKGGKARAAALSPEQRSEIARKAAAKRWANSRKGS